MKQRADVRMSAVIKIVIWSFVALILIGILGIAIASSGGGNLFDLGFSFGETGFTLFGGYVYDDADTYGVGNCTYGESIKNINIDWTAGKVSLSVWDGEGVKVEESGRINNQKDQMRTRVIGDTLDIKFAASGIRWGNSTPAKQLYVYIPKDMAVSLGNISVNTASADVCLSDTENGIICHAFDVECVSGKIELLGINAKYIDVEGVSSNIIVSGKLQELEVDGVSGDIEFRGELRKLDVKAVSGKLDLKLDNIPQKIDVETVSGNVDMELFADMDGFYAELDSVSGNMKLNGSDVGKSCSHGNKSASFDFNTVSGNVDINIKTR